MITLLWSLRDLAGIAREIEGRAAERFTDADADRNLEATRRLLAVALDVVHRIGTIYGTTGTTGNDDVEGALEEIFGTGGSGQADEVETMAPIPPPPDGPTGHEDEATRIASLATIAGLEIRERTDDLAALDPGGDPLEILAHASHARGAFLRAAIALEKLVCAAEGLRPRLASPQDLQRALAIRAAYADVARALCRDHPDDETPPSRECLARAADAIGRLLSCALTRHVRIADRIALARMHRRLHRQLSTPDPSDPDGLRTWQDLKGLFGMLLLVNNRQELREHDHEAARWLLEQLPLAGPARLGEREQEVLRLLADREPSLRVEAPDLASEQVAALRRTLLRMARELAPAHLDRDPVPA